MSKNTWSQAWSVLEDGAEATAWHAAAPGEETWVALRCSPADVARVGALPAEGVLSQAPLGDYDVIELSVFAKPRARVRWLLDETGDDVTGAVGAVSVVGEGEWEAASAAALVEAALDELWQEGAEDVTTLVPAAQAQAYEAAGWERIEAVSRA